MYKITVILDLWSKLQDGLHQIFEKLPSKEAKKCLKLFLLEIKIIHIFSQIFHIYKIYVFHIYKSMMNEWLDFGVFYKRFLLILHRFFGELSFTFLLIIYRLMISSNNNIKMEGRLFRFLSTACRTARDARILLLCYVNFPLIAGANHHGDYRFLCILLR